MLKVDELLYKVNIGSLMMKSLITSPFNFYSDALSLKGPF